MKINYFIFLLSCLFLQSLNGQHYSGTTKSQPPIKEKIKVRSYGYDSIGVIDGKAYFLFLPYQAVYNVKCVGCSRAYYIACFDNEMNLQNKKMLNLTWNNNEMEFEEIMKIGDKLMVILSYQNTKDKKHYLFTRELNPVTLDAEGNPKMIAELDYSGYSKYRKTALVCRISDDQSKVMILYTFLNNDFEILRSGLHVYNDAFDDIWKLQNIKPEKSVGSLEYTLFKIDNQGNVYLVGINYGEKTYRDWTYKMDRSIHFKGYFYFDRPNYKYEMYAYIRNGRDILYKEIGLEKKFIRAFEFQPQSPDSVTCYGLWSNAGMVSPKGAFMYQLDLTKGITSYLSFNEFGTHPQPYIISESEIGRFKKDINNDEEWDPFNYRLSRLMTRPDGVSFFIAEQWTEGKKEEAQGKSIVYKHVFIQGDLFITFSSSGNEKMQTVRIPKNQFMMLTNMAHGYFLTQKDNNIILVFSHLPRQKRYRTKMPIGEQVMADIDKNREVSITTLHKNIPLNDFYMVTRATLRVSEDVIGYFRASLIPKMYLLEKLTIIKE